MITVYDRQTKELVGSMSVVEFGFWVNDKQREQVPLENYALHFNTQAINLEQGNGTQGNL